MAEDGKPLQGEREIFQSAKIYKAETICARSNAQSGEYALVLLSRKLELVTKHHKPGLTLDLCCATGGHLFDLGDRIRPAIGIDFSEPFIAKAIDDAAEKDESGIAFAVGNAKLLPLPGESISTLYCLSSLYVIPNVEDVFSEVARVLKVGGHAILDLGNSRSLNAYCSRHYPDIARQHLLTTKQMHQSLSKAGLNIVEWRAFQILPLWTDRPRWLWPLLHPGWKKILKTRIAGKMLDEWISNLPLLRSLAFRHIVVCEKQPQEGMS